VQAYRVEKRVRAGFRVDHRRAHEEPLLWLPDIVAGAVRSRHDGQPQYYERIQHCVELRMVDLKGR
jgi:hypothetical protein